MALSLIQREGHEEATSVGSLSAMMSEIPAVEEMIEKRPDTAMRDIGKMTRTMSEMMGKMADFMTEMKWQITLGGAYDAW